MGSSRRRWGSRRCRRRPPSEELDASGKSTAPKLAVPDLQALAGLQLILDFAVLDFTQPCWIQAISEPMPLTVQ